MLCSVQYTELRYESFQKCMDYFNSENLNDYFKRLMGTHNMQPVSWFRIAIECNVRCIKIFKRAVCDIKISMCRYIDYIAVKWSA